MKWALSFAVTAALLVLLVRYIEGRSIFFPMKDLTATPADIGLAYEEVTIAASDGTKLYGWFVPRAGADDVVLFLHGNAGNVGHRLDKIRMLNGLGVATLIIDYRGYGRSEGRPSERGLYRDADAAYEHLVRTRGVPAGRIVVYGESLGGAVAVDLAARRTVRALITEGTFTSVPAMVRASLPFVPSAALGSRFDSLSKIGRVAAPKLFIHSADDEIVPYAMGEILYGRAGEPKELMRLRGGHNTAFLDSAAVYITGLRRFVGGLRTPQDPETGRPAA